MKRQLIYLLASAAILAGGCQKESGAPESGYGRIKMACGADLAIDTRAAAAPSGSDFALILTGEEGYKGEWATVAEFAAQDTLFMGGAYKAEISLGDPDAEGADKPYFYASEEFTVRPLYTSTVELTAKIANSQVLVRTTEQFLAYFHDVKFTVETGSGSKFEFTPGAATADAPVYVKAATSLSVTGTAKKQSQTGTSEGVSVTFGKETLGATKPGTRHIFEFDAKSAGSATLTITLGEDENPIVIPDVELNEGAIHDNE